MADPNEVDTWVHNTFGVHPAGYQAGGPAPAGVAQPPDGLLRRKGDNAQLWDPAPQATMAGSEAAAGADWVRDQLNFFGFAPPDVPDPSGQGCVFNGAASTVSAVLDVLDKQATLSGYKFSKSSAQGVAGTLLASHAAAQKQGADVVAGGVGADSVKALAKLDMVSLLDALQVIRKQGKIDDVAKLGLDDRMTVAVLSVQRKLGEKWTATVTKLKDADQEAVRKYVYGRINAGDVPVAAAKQNAQGQVLGDDGTDDKTWASTYLKFHKLAPDPLNGAGKSAMLDGKTQAVDDIIDTVCEQSATAGRMPVDRAVVRGVVKGVISSRAVADALAKASVSKTRVSGAIAFGFSPGMQHKDLATGDRSKDNPTIQLSGQVTLEIHPENGSGIELSWVAQVTGFKGDNTGKTDFNFSALSGPQAAWVQSFFKGLLKLEPLVQVLGGVATAQQADSGKLRLVQAGQVAAGGQIVFTVPGTNGKLSFGVQSTVGVTGAGGAHTTMDWGAQGFAQWNF